MGLFNFFKKKANKKEKIDIEFIGNVDLSKIKKYISTPKSIEHLIEKIDEISVHKEKDAETKTNELLEIYESLTDTEKRNKEGRYLIIRIGEVYFSEKKIEEALENFSFVMRFKDTLGNPFLHLRLGQLQYVIQNEERMYDELSRALIMGGESVFEKEDVRFLSMVKSVLKEPVDSTWKEYEGQDWKDTK